MKLVNLKPGKLYVVNSLDRNSLGFADNIEMFISYSKEPSNLIEFERHYLTFLRGKSNQRYCEVRFKNLPLEELDLGYIGEFNPC